MESDYLQYFELLCFLKSSLLDLLQASVGERESGQIGNIGEDSGIENGNLNIATWHHNFIHDEQILPYMIFWVFLECLWKQTDKHKTQRKVKVKINRGKGDSGFELITDNSN